MISTCHNDFKMWSFAEQVDVRNQYLSGECLEMIGRDCHRHAKNVCLELIRQGVLDEKDDISRGHIRFERNENLHDESESEYSGSEYSEYVLDNDDSDASLDSEFEDSESVSSEESDLEDIPNIHVKNINKLQQQIDSIYAILGNLQKCVLTLMRPSSANSAR